jgi:hypothetical protein
MTANDIQMTEENIERHIEHAVKYYGDSDMCLKYTCIAASPVVGLYDGGTQAIASQIRRSPSTVENYAHAHWLYRELRSGEVRIRVRILWRSLPASHWWQAWDIHKAGYNAFYYLNNADLHKWSGREMMGEYRKDREAGNAPLVFTRAITALRGLIDELTKSKSLTQKQRAALAAVREAFADFKGW